MLQGLYAAASGMEAQQTQLDAVANDIANSDTPGYQSEEIGFRDLLFNSSYGGVDTVSTGTGAAAQMVGFDQAAGTLVPTGNPLDVGIGGSGYLQVRQSDGTIGLTRNGTLQLNAKGELTTNLGMPLQPPITVPPGTQPSDVTISADGTVSVGSRNLGKISVVTVPAPDQMLPSGGGVFSSDHRQRRGHRGQRHDATAGIARAVECRHQHRDDDDDDRRAELRPRKQGDPVRESDGPDRLDAQAMSFVTPTDSLGLAGSGSTGLPPISAADLPASVRSGPPAAKQAYTEALEFEQVLVNQLAQQLTATATQSSTDSSGDSTDGSDDSSSDSSSDGLGDASTGMLGSDPSSSLLSTPDPAGAD